MKTLVIAEKPSVATDLARVLGKVKKNGDFYENDEYIISSAVGHLVELFMPDDIDKNLKRWSLKNLPIIPEKFELKPIEKAQSKKKLQELKKLLKRSDVDLVINACDAGREGELIFTYIYELAKCKKPSKRLWMLSMTPEGIRESFKHLRENDEMLRLQQAARCRSESDWLIGINGTRAITARMFGSRRGQAATVGRVQTPTLSLVIERELEIRNFTPRAYWKITGHFGIASGEYDGIFQKESWKKNDDEHDRVDRIWSEDEATALVAQAQTQPMADVTEEKKRSTTVAPRLYDLTTLQREANNRFGLPAAKTLRIAQALYEKHKVLTYPRTDSKALPEDYPETVRRTLADIQGSFDTHAETVLKNNWINPKNKRVFNNAQISDHFAIIPTGHNSDKLSDEEYKIYDMVVRRFIAIFFPVAEFDVTTRLSKVGELNFKTTGKVLVKPGWMEVYGKDNTGDDHLPPVTTEDGQPPKAKVLEVVSEGDETRPPPRYSEATLLAAMEGAGKMLEDEELADAMKEKGLGTPATRAGIIDHLIKEKYMDREGRELIPSTKAETLMEFLKHVKIEDLTSPAMTGEWEHRLHQIEQGKLTREDFMKGIAELTTRMVERTRDFEETDGPVTETDIISPTDGKPLIETFRAFRSRDEQIAIYKTVGNRRLEVNEVKELLEKRLIGPLDGFRSKAGKPFSAMLRLDEENKVKFVFNNAGEGGENGEPEDLSEFQVIAQCPKTGTNIHETPNAYVWAEAPKDGRAPRISRTILGRSIPPEQFLKMLNEGKTDLLDKFRSKRTGKLFSAFLVLKDNMGIGFEFAPRKTAKKAAKKATKKTASAKSKPESDDE